MIKNKNSVHKKNIHDRFWCVITGSLMLLIASVISASADNVTVSITPDKTWGSVGIFNNASGLSYTIDEDTPSVNITVAVNDVLTVSAYPANPHVFVNWSLLSGTMTPADQINPSDADYTVTGNGALRAVFGLPQRELVVQSDNHHSVIQVNGSSVTVPYTNSYDLGESVAISATPISASYEFDVWGSDAAAIAHPAVTAAASAVSDITMDNNHTVKAYFNSLFTLTQREPNGDTTAPQIDSYASNQVVYVQVYNTIVNRSPASDPTQRDICSGWTGGINISPAVGNSPEYGNLQMVSDVELTWTWDRQYRLRITKVGEGDVSPGSATNIWYNDGALASMVASAAEGYVFNGWFESGVRLDGNANYSTNMTGAHNLTAQFIVQGSDSDQDGLPDAWEADYGLKVDPGAGVDHGGLGDPDNDGFSNFAEWKLQNTNATLPYLYSSPINADTDYDGMDDFYERVYIDPEILTFDAEGGPLTAVLDNRDSTGRGAQGNLDNDFKWSTEDGYRSPFDPLRNKEEWTGPDGEAPLRYEIVPAGAPSSDGSWTNTLAKPVRRAFARSEDTGDQSASNHTDSDLDGFDDGFEYSWDIWQQLNSGFPEVFVYSYWGDAVTNFVPIWDGVTNLTRRFNPAVSHVDTSANQGETDFDVLYDYGSGGVSGTWYADLLEYNAWSNGVFSLAIEDAPHEISRHVHPNWWRCSHPFRMDVDRDGLPDGYEVIFGLDPWARVSPGSVIADGNRNPDGDFMAFVGGVTNFYHKAVYDEYEYDPRTGWGANYPDWYQVPFWPRSQSTPSVNTRAFSNLDEMYGANGKMKLTPKGDDTTSPTTQDTDGDGMWDGWEHYVGLNPLDHRDAAQGGADDRLSNLAEFQSFVTGAHLDSINPATPLPHWMNKIFPTDPNDPDTDGDGILDGYEVILFNNPSGTYEFTFPSSTTDSGLGLFTNSIVGGEYQFYRPPLDLGGQYVAGGLNPTSCDTDHDGIPDSYEATFPDSMNGALLDSWDDPDGDKLLNYREYLTASTYHWQYDVWSAGASYYNPADFFVAPKEWDWFQTCNNHPFSYIPFLGVVWQPPLGTEYNSTNPGDEDSDGDGMDDFWEIFHGLNPVYGYWDLLSGRMGGVPITVLKAGQPLVADPRVSPWVNGTHMMDSDADGIVNIDESVGLSLQGTPTHHSDPSPYWITDMSYDNSWVNLYYKSYPMVYWFMPSHGSTPAPEYIFSFETNEGYDTDNDNESDYAEIVDGSTGPIDDESPIKRRAMYFPETDGYARTRKGYFYGTTQLREFTVEAWIRPEVPQLGRDQIIVERPFMMLQGNPMDIEPGIRLNFRVGLNENGQPFASYNGSGSQLIFVEALASTAWVVASNEWSHISATYELQSEDKHGRLKLYVNGQLAATVISDEVPCTGFWGVTDIYWTTGPLVIGASDENPNGSIPEELNGVPEPVNFFRGWVDEVRVWSGSRSQAEISSTMSRSLSRSLGAGDYRTGFSALMSRYGFDDVPDPQHGGIVPDGFGATMSSIQPADWSSIPWLSGSPERSQVYRDYQYVTWCSDTMEHFPATPPIDIGDTNVVSSNGVVIFPNPADPYSEGFWTAPCACGAKQITDSDVLPLRWAEADADVEMWDMSGLGTDSYDTDGDGIPDWWEEEHGLDPLTPEQGADGNPDDDNDSGNDDADNDGLSNLYEYLTGNDPNVSDTDGDGESDAIEDFDGDGLSNIAELNADTLPHVFDTDDDGVSDWEELTGSVDGDYDLIRPDTSEAPIAITDPLDSLDPDVYRSMKFDGNARLIIPPQNKLMVEEWAIEMWVNPDLASDGGVLLSRYVGSSTVGNYGVNYELGLTTNNAPAGYMRPYVMYKTIDRETRLDGTGNTDHVNGLADILIPMGEWSHIAATYMMSEFNLSLYINSELAAYRTDATDVPPTVYGYSSGHMRDEITVGASRSTGVINNGFEGLIDELRFWRGSRSADEIAKYYNAPQAVPVPVSKHTVNLTSSTFVPAEGMSDKLLALPEDDVTHALIQFNDVPTATDIAAVEAAGVSLLNYVGPNVRMVSASPSSLKTLDCLRWSGVLSGSDKIASHLNVNGLHDERPVLVQFFEDVSESEALDAAATAGVTLHNNGYLSPQYAVMSVTDDKIVEMASDSRVAWIVPAAPGLLTGDFVFFGGDTVAVDDLEVAPFVTVGDGWDGPGLGSAALTYYFKNATEDLDIIEQQSAIVDQMLLWGSVAALTFEETLEARQPFSIDIDFLDYDGSLAFAFYPNDRNPEPVAGDIRFNDTVMWVIGDSPGSDIRWVALHELGHSLGIGHSADPTAIMYPYYSGAKSTPVLSRDDVDAILNIYGGAAGYGMAEFRFDDGGETAEDFSSEDNWISNWDQAGVLDGAEFYTNSTALLDKDSDEDGMPDVWEIANDLDPYSASGDDGANGDPDEDGLINIYEYQAGMDPWSVDSDRDGTSDIDEDSDGDGLSNGDEVYRFGTDPGLSDTDDDGFLDGDEINWTVTCPSNSGRRFTSPLFSRAPLKQHSLVLDGTGVVVPSGAPEASDRFDLSVWTLECWIMTTNGLQTGGLITRETRVGQTNFALRLDSNMPSVVFTTDAGVRYSAGLNMTIPTNEWTHLAGVWDPSNDALWLYVNGVGYQSQASLSSCAQGVGDVIIGQGVSGLIDEVRIWDSVRTPDEIQRWEPRILSNYKDRAGAGGGDIAIAYPNFDPVHERLAELGLAYTFIDESEIMDPETYQTYGSIFFPCLCPEAPAYDPAVQQYLRDFVSGGGNLYVACWSGAYLDEVWSDKAELSYGPYYETTADIVDPEVAAYVGASSIDIPIGYDCIDSFNASVNQILDDPNDIGLIAFSFNYGAGKVIYTDFHSEDGMETNPEQNRFLAWIAKAVAGSSGSSYITDMPVAYYTFDDGGETAEDYANELNTKFVLTGVEFATNDHANLVGTFDADLDDIPDWWQSYNWKNYGDTIEVSETNMVLVGSNYVEEVTTKTVAADGSWLADSDPDNDGLNNLYEFYSDTNPRAESTDNNGISDDLEDRDGDGVVNIKEQELSSRPDMVDTDDDGLTDGEEVLSGSDVVDGLSPFVERVLSLDGAGYVEIPKGSDATRFALDSFTVEAWIYLESLTQSCTVVRRQIGDNQHNFNLGICSNTYGGFVPFLSVTPNTSRSFDGSDDSVAMARSIYDLPLGEWIHLAGSLDAANGELKLYINGEDIGQALIDTGVMTHGVGPVYGRVGEGFDGYIDEVRIWDYAKDPDALESGMHSRVTASGVMAAALAQFSDDSRIMDHIRHHVTSLAAIDGISEKGLVAYYRFDDSGDTIEDCTSVKDWMCNWMHAGIAVGSAVVTSDYSGRIPIQGLNEDLDEDGLPDYWEIANFGSIAVTDGSGDYDGDGLTDYYEYLSGTNPKLKDTDGDETLDGDEDPDGDGLTNLEEEKHGTNPQLVDTDDDTVSDGDELDPAVNGVSSPLHGMGAYDVANRSLLLTSIPLNGVDIPQFASDARGSLSSWTAEVSVFMSASATQSGVLLRKKSGVLTAFELGLEMGVPYVRYQTGTGKMVTCLGSQPIPDNRWIQVAGTWNSAESILRLHVNAIAMVEVDLNDDSVYLPTDLSLDAYGSMTIGASDTGWTAISLIDNIRIWNTALSAVELDDVMTAYVSSGLDGRLIRDFRFDDSGVMADDFAHLDNADYALDSSVYGIGLQGDGSAQWLANDGVECIGVDDADSDGMPDWFESVYQVVERAGDGDADELSNYYEYLCRTDPANQDTDDDGVYDGAEYYSEGAVTNDLTNAQEQQFGSDPRYDDTDDDGVSDYVEITGDGTWNEGYWPVSDPTLALQNTVVVPQVVRRSLSLNGSSRIVVPPRAKYALESWTVDAWIRPASVSGRHVIVRRAVADLGGGIEALNYELGIDMGAGNTILPYARFVTLNGTEFIVGGATGADAFGDYSVSVDEWSFVAGSFDDATGVMQLFVDGMLVGSNRVVQSDNYPPVTGPDPDCIEVSLGGGQNSGSVENGFIGNVDEVRVSAGAMGRVQVFANFRAADAMNSGGYQAGVSAIPGEESVTQLSMDKVFEHKYEENKILVRFKPGTTTEASDLVHTSHGGSVMRVGRIIPIHTVRIDDTLSMDVQLAAYRADPNVLYAEPNYWLTTNAIPNDPDFGLLWGMHNIGELGGTEDADIDAPEVWDRTVGNSDYVVAVIDTGVDYMHEDLVDNIWVNPGEIADNGIDDDGNGYVDDVHGYDFYDRDGDPMDDVGHGTHCSGTIGGVGNNGIGVAGVNWNVKIMGLRFLGPMGGWTDDAIEAIEYAVMMGVKVSNNSWGGGGYSQALYDSIEAAMFADHLFVAAAGNWGIDNDGGFFPSYPASYDLENIISVAATDDRDELAYFSNYGLESVDLGAPGVMIYSCLPGNEYEYYSGTSMAAPHVAGVAALIRALNSPLSFDMVKRMILTGVDKVDALDGKCVTGGRLNAANALQGSAFGAVAYFRCDDGGDTVEDMMVVNDLLASWRNAGSFDGGVFDSSEFATMPGDTDGDGMPNWFVSAYGVSDAYGDDDGDSLLNSVEMAASRNPLLSDSNNDNQADDQDDSDGDGQINLVEQQIGSDPGLLDTDDDGISDEDEFANLTHPALSLYPRQSLALSLDGSSDPILLANQPRFSLNNSWTVEAWVRPNATETDGFVLIRRSVGDVGVNYELGVNGSMLPYVSFANADGAARIVVGDIALAQEQWTHLAGVFDSSSRLMTLYVGGLRVADVATSITQPAADDVGAARVVLGDDLDGALDEVRIWSVVRDSDKIYRKFKTFLAGQEGGLKGYFRFDDGTHSSGTSLKSDWSHGQLQNFASGTMRDWRTEWFNAGSIVSSAAVSFVLRTDIVMTETDSDNDGIADWWEIYFFGNLITAEGLESKDDDFLQDDYFFGEEFVPTDFDGDGLSDFSEYLAGLDPTEVYTFGGVVSDGDLDSDGDGLSNRAEQDSVESNPGDPDTDDDGVSDGIEADNLSSPVHPMSVYSSDSTLWGIACPRSLDMGMVLEGNGIELPPGEKDRPFDWFNLDDLIDWFLGDFVEPVFERFEFGASGWTVEMWVYPETDLNGDLFVLEGVTGDDFRLSLVDGSPYAVIFNDLGVVAEVGGPIVGSEGAAPLVLNQWTHLAMVWDPESNTLRLYENAIMMFGQASLSSTANFGKARAFMARGFTDGYIDEVRVWDRTRERDEIADWYYRMVPAPGYVDSAPDGYIPSHYGPWRKDYTIIETDEYDLLSNGDEYKYRQPLLAYYRFDDGGDTIEDFAHLNDRSYSLMGPVTTNFAFSVLSWDDADGDGLPEWWVDMHKLDLYPDVHIGPYHVLQPGHGADYPVTYSAGWGTTVGTLGLSRGLYHTDEFAADEYDVFVYDYNVWQDVNPDHVPGATNRPTDQPDDGLWGSYPGRGTYDDWDVVVWPRDEDSWFTPTGTVGAIGMKFHDTGKGNGMYDGGEDVWFERWNAGSDTTYDMEPVVGIRYFRTFTSYGSIGAWTKVATVEHGVTNETLGINQYITTKSSSVGSDGLYSSFTKYIYLDQPPTSAEMELVLWQVDESELYINSFLYDVDADTNGVVLAGLLKQGRNQILLVTDNSVTWSYKEHDIHYKEDYVREITGMKFDMRLTLDGRDVIVRGDESVADPRSVWHGQAWSKWWEIYHVTPEEDGDDRLVYHQDYGISRDSEITQPGGMLAGDGLDNNYEVMLGTNPRDFDTDNDGVPDTHEDFDGDGLVNIDEQKLGSDPRLPDTDDDGVIDGLDVGIGSSPHKSLLPHTPRAALFGGTEDDYIEMPLLPRFALDNWTIEAWVSPTETSTGGSIMRRQAGIAGGGQDTFVMSVSSDMVPSVGFGSVMIVPQSAQCKVVNDGTNWTHLAATYDAVTRELILYVNGENVASTNSIIISAAYGSGPVIQRIGESFAGRIDDVRIWDHARTYDEMLADRLLPLLGSEDGLVAYYRFDDGTSAVAGNGVSGHIGWKRGQVQDFVYDYNMDWTTAWINGATLHGDASMVAITSDIPTDGDSDNDGLPDWWEETHDLDRFSDSLENGRYGDPDHDGLINLYEYLAAVEYGVYLNPWVFGTFTTNILSDFYTKPTQASLTFGEMYDDTDVLPDGWESQAPMVMDRHYYHRDQDPDHDEWNNQEEYLAGTDPNSATSAPSPMLSGVIQYNGASAGSDAFSVLAYESADMDTVPVAGVVSSVDGVFTYAFSNISSRTVWLLAYKSVSGGSEFVAGDAYGIAGPISVSFDGTTDVIIPVLDQLEMPWFGAFTWPSPSAVPSVYVRLKNFAGELVMTRWIHSDRNTFHAVDYKRCQPTTAVDYSFGLPPGNYSWTVASNDIPNLKYQISEGALHVPNYTPPTPEIVSPSGVDLIVHQLHNFVWTSDPQIPVPQYQIEITPDAGGWTYTTNVSVQASDLNGTHVLRMPLQETGGDLFGSGRWVDGEYSWRLRSSNNSIYSSWSESRRFEIAVTNAPPQSSGAPQISGNIIYHGIADADYIVVRAFNSPGYDGRVEGQLTMSTTAPFDLDFTLSGLRHVTYSLMAFIDLDQDGEVDEWEPQGLARDKSFGSHYEYRADAYGLGKFALDGVDHVENVSILIRDRDTDNDNVMDGWEWLNMHNSPNGITYGGDDDMDGDGLSNLEEYGLNSDPTNADSDGDGISDGDEVNIYGSSPTSSDSDGDGFSDGYEVETLGLSPTNPDDDGDGVPTLIEVTWCMDPLLGDSDGDGVGDLMEIASGSSPVDDSFASVIAIGSISRPFDSISWDVGANDYSVDVTYIIEYSFDMVTWTAVGELTADGDNFETLTKGGINSPAEGGFYRLRLVIR